MPEVWAAQALELLARLKEIPREVDAIWDVMRRVVGEPPPVPPFDEEEMARLKALVEPDLARLEALLEEETKMQQEFENRVPQELMEKLTQRVSEK